MADEAGDRKGGDVHEAVVGQPGERLLFHLDNISHQPSLCLLGVYPKQLVGVGSKCVYLCGLFGKTYFFLIFPTGYFTILIKKNFYDIYPMQ